MAPQVSSTILSKLIKGFISLAILGVLIMFLDLDKILSVLSTFSFVPILIAFLVLVFEFPILGFRWYLIIKQKNKLGFLAHLKLYFIANFFNTFTPAQIGGDVYRLYGLWKKEIDPRFVVGKLVQERLIGLVGFFIFLVCCMTFTLSIGLLELKSFSDPLYVVFIFSIASIIIFFIAVNFGERITNYLISHKWLPDYKWITNILTVIHESMKYPSFYNLSLIFLLSIFGGGVIWTLAVFIVAGEVGVETHFAMIGIAAIMSDVIRFIPISIQGIGVREAAFTYTFFLLGLDPEKGFVIGLISYVGVWAATAIIGIIGYFLPEKN